MAGPQGDDAGGTGRRRLLAGGAAALAALGLSSGCDAQAAPSADGAPPSGRKPRGRGIVDVVADFGAKGDGRTDDSEAFEKAYAYAVERVWGDVGRTVIDIPPGSYLITRPGALLNGTEPDKKANGLRFRGAGKRMTEILFRPEKADGSYLCRNEDQWANLMFEHIRFRSGTPGASFFYSYSTGQAQDYRFSECEWMGEWAYGLALDGSNTNSEMRWDACRVGGAYRKAYLYSGLSEKSKNKRQQDQFLNYWFNDMKVEYEWGNFLEFPYGGSITCRGGSYIVTGRRPDGDGEYGRTSTFFRFPRGEHHDAVQRFHAEDIRFEVRSPDVIVIDCSWNSGTVHFNDCDDTANAFKGFAKDAHPHRYDLGLRGPLVRYDSCQLTGRHEYRISGGSIPAVVRYDMCLLKNHPVKDFLRASGAESGHFARFTDCLGS